MSPSHATDAEYDVAVVGGGPAAVVAGCDEQALLGAMDDEVITASLDGRSAEVSAGGE